MGEPNITDPVDINCEQTAECKGHAIIPGGTNSKPNILMLDGKRSCPTCFNAGVKQLSRCVRIPFMDLKIIRSLLDIGHLQKAISMLDQMIKEKFEDREQA